MTEQKFEMTIEAFWDLIEEVRLATPGDMEQRGDLLHDELFSWKFEHVQQFYLHFHTLMHRSYSWDLWGAMWVMNRGGGEDDAFSDFRENLIAQGRSIFEQVLAEADNVADIPEAERDGLTSGGFGHEINEVYRRKLKSPIRQALESPDVELPPEPDNPHGVRFNERNEQGLQQRYPRTYARFWPQ